MCDLFSHYLQVSVRSRILFLLAGDEGIVARDRDGLEDDVEGDSGPWRICFQTSFAKSKHSTPRHHKMRVCPIIINSQFCVKSYARAL